MTINSGQRAAPAAVQQDDIAMANGTGLELNFDLIPRRFSKFKILDDQRFSELAANSSFQYALLIKAYTLTREFFLHDIDINFIQVGCGLQ